MKVIKNEAEIVKNRFIKGIYHIRLKKTWMDNFGKISYEYKIWDSYSTLNIAERNLEHAKTQMRNCGHLINEID